MHRNPQQNWRSPHPIVWQRPSRPHPCPKQTRARRPRWTEMPPPAFCPFCQAGSAPTAPPKPPPFNCLPRARARQSHRICHVHQKRAWPTNASPGCPRPRRNHHRAHLRQPQSCPSTTPTLQTSSTMKSPKWFSCHRRKLRPNMQPQASGKRHRPARNPRTKPGSTSFISPRSIL